MMLRTPLVTSFVAGLAVLGAGSAAATSTPLSHDPAGIVQYSLDHRDSTDYTCPATMVWNAPGSRSVEPPFVHKQHQAIDIRSYDPASFRVRDAGGEFPGYVYVDVDVRGYERAETRTFVLGPTADGYCIGDLLP